MDERVNGILTKFVDDTNLGKVTNTQKGNGKIKKTQATTVGRDKQVEI